MKKKLLLIPCLILCAVIVNAQSVVINKVFNNTNTTAEYGGSVNGQGDAIELLVLEDHTDLRRAYIKDTYNINTAPFGLKEGAIWQFTDHVLWSDLRAGTTIQLVRPPISPAEQPVLDTDVAGDHHLLIPLSATFAEYIVSVPSNPDVTPPATYLLNLQLRDAVALKRGDSPYGFGDLIHMLMIGYETSEPEIRSEYDAIEGNKVLTNNTLTGGTTSNGYMFFRNITAASAPHDALGDYLGVDDDNNRNIIGWITTNVPPAWGIGQSNADSQNAVFISYLRVSPKIEQIVAQSSESDSETAVFRVTFNKEVSNVTVSDFDIEATGSALGTITGVSGNGTTWDVTMGNLSGIGTVRLVKKATTGITDNENNRMFNGFVYRAENTHAVDREIILEKPAAPQIAGVINGASDDLTPVINGTVLANVRVDLYIDGEEVNEVIQSDQSGNWSYTPSVPLSQGDHTFYITITVQNVTSEPSDGITVNFVEYVTGIPASAKSVVVNKVFNSGGTADDVVELLVLDDHVDLANLFIKDQAGNTSSSTAYNDNGGKYQFKDIPLWRNLRSGTTIVLRKSPSAASGYVLDDDPSDQRLDISLDNSQYFNVISASFNTQNYDMVVLKGGSSATGYDQIVHAFISGVNNNTRAAFNAFPEPKVGINALIPTTNGFLYANNPTAASAPHLGIDDYSGFTNTDKPAVVAAGTIAAYNPDPPLIKTSFNEVVPAWHIGEEGTNRAFIEYLRAAPKVERIFPETSGGKGSSVRFTVIFNKDVTGADASDFRILATNSAAGRVSAVEGTGSTYTVTVSDLSGEGYISLVKKARGTGITDGANLFLEGFEYVKSNTYYVDGLPVVIPAAEAPEVVGAVNGRTDNFTPVIAGTANAGAQVNLYIDDVLVEETITGSIAGDWSYIIPEPLTIGVHTFHITTTASYGTSDKSPVTSVDFAVKVPEAPVVEGAENGISNRFRPVVRGTGSAGTTINLYVDDVLVADGLQVDEWEQTWSYQLTDELSAGQHAFSVTATNAIGTSEKSEKTTVLFKLFTGQITVNNILSPNGDGRNDVWLIENLLMYPKHEVVVFDKAGKVVFRKENYQQDWNGIADDGTPLSAGTYYYHISFGPDLKPLKGYITIIR